MFIHMILLCVLINDTVTDFSKFQTNNFPLGLRVTLEGKLNMPLSSVCILI